jgi:hypothetical protein
MKYLCLAYYDEQALVAVRCDNVMAKQILKRND